jgi:hypothetical protein
VLPTGQVSVIINVQCDMPGEASSVTPRFTGFFGDVYVFDVMTPLACAPSIVVDCLVYGPNGQKYDLTPLIRRKDNWEIYNSDGKEKFLINVCHALNPVNGSWCSG